MCEGAAHRLLKIGQRPRARTRTAEGAGELRKIGRMRADTDRVETAPQHAVADRRESVVIPDDDRNTELFLDCRRQLVDGEHEAAVTDQRDGLAIRKRDLAADRSR